jgi:hypothetical protein
MVGSVLRHEKSFFFFTSKSTGIVFFSAIALKRPFFNCGSNYFSKYHSINDTTLAVAVAGERRTDRLIFP